jgi:hypothetical protein
MRCPPYRNLFNLILNANNAAVSAEQQIMGHLVEMSRSYRRRLSQGRKSFSMPKMRMKMDLKLTGASQGSEDPKALHSPQRSIDRGCDVAQLRQLAVWTAES